MQRPPRSHPSTTSTRANTTTTGPRLARRERAPRRGRGGRREARRCGWSTWVGAGASGRPSTRLSWRRPRSLRPSPTTHRLRARHGVAAVPSCPCGRATRGMESRPRRRPARHVRGPGSSRDPSAAFGSTRAGRQAAVHPTPPVARSTGRSTPDRGSGAGVPVAASGAALRAGDGLDGCPGRGRRSGGVAPVDRVEGSLGSGE